MEKPIAEFKLNDLPIFIYIAAILVPIIIFARLLTYNIILSISVGILVSLYELWVIKGERNYPFKIYNDRLEGKVRGKMYKINSSQIHAITKAHNIVSIYDGDNNLLLKVTVKKENEEFITVLEKTFPNKISA